MVLYYISIAESIINTLYGDMEAFKIQTIKGKFTKVYLRKCRWCNNSFYTESFNRYYCGDEHAKEGRKETKRKYYSKYKVKYFLKEELRKPGTCKIGPHRNPDFAKELKIIRKEKRRVLSRVNYEGEHKSTLPGAEFSPTHEYVTLDDLHAFSISYLKDNQVKCPECDNKTNLIEHGLSICSECGLILKAPSIHPGYIVDDLLSKRKICATVQDVNISTDLKGAYELAFMKYHEQIALIDVEVVKEDILNFTDSDPLNPAYWKHYKKKVYCKG